MILFVVELALQFLSMLLNPLGALFLPLSLMLIPIQLLLAIIMFFIGASIIHVFVLLFGGRRGYTNTVKAISYGFTLSFLLGIILLPLSAIFQASILSSLLQGPASNSFALFALFIVVALAGALWILYTITRGISVLQEISMWRALAALLTPVVLVALIFTLIFFAVLGSTGTAV